MVGSQEAEPKLCRRCNDREVTLKIRSEAICGFVTPLALEQHHR